ncbi:hypothetical protein QNN00_18670 [Bacillus velezensis]|nr:hypothetical protein [Bacillus velezensis]
MSEAAPETDDPKRLAALWAEGKIIDWNKLYASGKPRKTSVPTYPFAKNALDSQTEKTGEKPVRHSTASAFTRKYVRFFSVTLHVSFTGDEFFLSDHVVNGQKYCRASPIWKWPQRRSKSAAVTEKA